MMNGDRRKIHSRTRRYQSGVASQPPSHVDPPGSLTGKNHSAARAERQVRTAAPRTYGHGGPRQHREQPERRAETAQAIEQRGARTMPIDRPAVERTRDEEHGRHGRDERQRGGAEGVPEDDSDGREGAHHIEEPIAFVRHPKPGPLLNGTGNRSDGCGPRGFTPCFRAVSSFRPREGPVDATGGLATVPPDDRVSRWLDLPSHVGERNRSPAVAGSRRRS